MIRVAEQKPAKSNNGKPPEALPRRNHPVASVVTAGTALAVLILGTGLVMSGCEPPVRHAEWDAIRAQPIHDASPPGSAQVGRDTNPPRKLIIPGMGSAEGWVETVYASPLPPQETFNWYAQRFQDRYRMRRFSDGGQWVLQGSLAGERPMVISVSVSASRPQYGNIFGRFPDGPSGTQSYALISVTTR